MTWTLSAYKTVCSRGSLPSSGSLSECKSWLLPVCPRDDFSETLGQCHRESTEAASALEGPSATAGQQHAGWCSGLPAMDKGAVHHWTQARGLHHPTSIQNDKLICDIVHVHSETSSISSMTDLRHQYLGDHVQKPFQPGNHFPNHRYRSFRSVSRLAWI